MTELLGVVIGAALALMSTWLLQEKSRQRRIRNWSIAVGGEFAALAEMVRRRRYVELVSEAAHQASAGIVRQVEVRIPPQLLPTSRRASEFAGDLPGKLPALLPRLIMITDAFALDFDVLRKHGLGDPDGFLASSEAAYTHYSELLGLLLNGLSLSDDLVAEVVRIYPGTEFWVAPPYLTEQVSRGPAGPPDLPSHR